MISIVTPTYNRAYTLKRLYDSLNRQSDDDFEWIIVDDGSIDDTEKLVESFIQVRKLRFPIHYYKKNNEGKHVALNYAHPYIHGEWVFVVDSDDLLTDDAVENVKKYGYKYRNNDRIACLIFEKGGMDGTEFGSGFPDDELIGNVCDVEENAGLDFDKANVIRTTLLKQYPFVKFTDEKFLGESYLWLKLARKYDNVYIRKVIYKCEYLPDGLSKKNRRNQIKSPNGVVAVSELYFYERIVWWIQIKKMLLYIAYGKIAGHSTIDLYSRIKRPYIKLLYIAMYPWGLLLKSYRLLRYSEKV